MTAKGSVTPGMACGSRPVEDDPEPGAFPAVGIHQRPGVKGAWPYAPLPPPPSGRLANRPIRQRAERTNPDPSDEHQEAFVGSATASKSTAPKTAGFAQLSPPYGAAGGRSVVFRLLRVRAVRAADDYQQQSQLEQTREKSPAASRSGSIKKFPTRHHPTGSRRHPLHHQ